ncbi:hypothetical protein ACFLQV_02105 [Calditrichota bacterium]
MYFNPITRIVLFVLLSCPITSTASQNRENPVNIKNICNIAIYVEFFEFDDVEYSVPVEKRWSKFVFQEVKIELSKLMPDWKVYRYMNRSNLEDKRYCLDISAENGASGVGVDVRIWHYTGNGFKQLSYKTLKTRDIESIISHIRKTLKKLPKLK